MLLGAPPFGGVVESLRREEGLLDNGVHYFQVSRLDFRDVIKQNFFQMGKSPNREIVISGSRKGYGNEASHPSAYLCGIVSRLLGT